MKAIKLQGSSELSSVTSIDTVKSMPWQHIVASLPSGIIILDGEGVIIDYNPAAEQLMGLPLKGLAWVKVIHRCVMPRDDDGHEVSLQDGRQVRITTASLDPIPGQLIQITDLTETRTLQAIRHRQQRLIEMGEMSAHLAHQVRTPLATAMLYSNNLTKQNLSPAKHSDYCRKLSASLHHMAQQVNDMLLFAKGGQGPVQYIAVEKLIQDVIAVMDSQIQLSAAVITIDNQLKHAAIHCHTDAMVGALQNLINNAIEASSEKPKLTIVIRTLDNKLVDIIVSDQGKGMDNITMGKALQPFFTTKSKGTGLGLAVVQAVAQTHNGDVWIESQMGVGTKVGIRLPLVTNSEGENDE